MTRFIIAPKPWGWWEMDPTELRRLCSERFTACEAAHVWLTDTGADFAISETGDKIMETCEVVFEIADDAAAVGFKLKFWEFVE